MASDPKPTRLTLPWAVLLGLVAIGVFVSMAVFLALRPRELPPYSPASVGPLSAAAPVSAAKAAPLSGASADAASRLASQHAALVSACWTPLPGKPAALTWSVRVGFDARGEQASKLMLTPMGQVRPDVTECIAGAFAPLSIEPANAPATVEIPLTLP